MNIIIGYGNEMRRDDGVGPVVARTVDLPDVEVRTAHGLVPELAEPLSHADRVVFIDAAEGDEVSVIELKPEGRPGLGHFADPGWLLGLARVLGTAPRAWLVTVPAYDFGHGVGLSDRTQAMIPRAVEEVRRCMKSA